MRAYGRFTGRQITCNSTRACQKGVTLIVMKGITIKFSEPVLQRLRREARKSGRSVAAVIRERVEKAEDGQHDSVYALASDLAGCLAGKGISATNDRKKFRRS